MFQHHTSNNIKYYIISTTHQLGNSCASLLGP